MSTSNAPILQKESVVNPIYSITPFTLLDYPDKTACIIWFAGCNMRCAYCYNPDIVLGKGKISTEEVLKFLRSRKGLLDGVVLSGGECTLHKNIVPFIHAIKEIGMLVKIDTNGSSPGLLKTLIEQNLVDYIALDFKAIPQNYTSITKSDLFSEFEQSFDLLSGANITFEVRTTIHPELISKVDLQKMVSFLESKNYQGNYYLQNFVNDTTTIENIGNSARKLKLSDIEPGKINVVVRN